MKSQLAQYAHDLALLFEQVTRQKTAPVFDPGEEHPPITDPGPGGSPGGQRPPSPPPPPPAPPPPTPLISATKSALTTDRATLPADGVSFARITAKIRDNANATVSGVSCRLVAKSGFPGSLTPSTQTTDAVGTAQFQAKSPQGTSTYVDCYARDPVTLKDLRLAHQVYLVFQAETAPPPPAGTNVPSRIRAGSCTLSISGPQSNPTGTVVSGTATIMKMVNLVISPMEGAIVRVVPIAAPPFVVAYPSGQATDVNGECPFTVTSALPDASILDLYATDPESIPLTEIRTSPTTFLIFT